MTIALGAIGQWIVGDSLTMFELHSTLFTLIYVGWHNHHLGTAFG